MHKEIINGAVDLVPDLKRYRCTLIARHTDACKSEIFACSYDACHAHEKAVAHFLATCSSFALHPQEFTVEVVEDSRR